MDKIECKLKDTNDLVIKNEAQIQNIKDDIGLMNSKIDKVIEMLKK